MDILPPANLKAFVVVPTLQHVGNPHHDSERHISVRRQTLLVADAVHEITHLSPKVRILDVNWGSEHLRGRKVFLTHQDLFEEDSFVFELVTHKL